MMIHTPEGYGNTTMLLIIVFVLMMWLVVKIRNRVRQKQKRCRAAGWRIMWLVCRSVLFFACAVVFAVAGLLLLSWRYAQIDINGMIAGICVTAVFTGLFSLLAAQEKLKATRILRCVDLQLDATLSGRILERRGGVWRCADEEWFICIGDGGCAILYLPLIDLNATVYTWTEWGIKGGIYYSVGLCIPGLDGKIFYISQCFASEALCWLEERRSARRKKRREEKYGKQKRKRG